MRGLRASWPILAATPLLCLAIASAYYFFEDDVGLSANLATELLGIAATVFIIDWLLRFREQRRLQPARYAAFREARLIYWLGRSLWRVILADTIDRERDSVVINDPNIEMFDQPYLAMIERLDIVKTAPVVPEMSWREFLEFEVDRIDDAISKFLSRDSHLLDPRVRDAIHDLEISDFLHFVRFFPSMAAWHEQRGNPDSQFVKFSEESVRGFGEAMRRLRDLLHEHQTEFLAQIPSYDRLEGKDAWLAARRKTLR